MQERLEPFGSKVAKYAVFRVFFVRNRSCGFGGIYLACGYLDNAHTATVSGALSCCSAIANRDLSLVANRIAAG